MYKLSKSLTFFLTFLATSHCIQANTNVLSFSKLPSVEFPSDKKNLRQWDTPIFADLDKDGLTDIVINDHGYAIRVFWNKGSSFSKPYDVVVGDMHGVTVADIDFDGLNELLIARGGGSGSNARNGKIFKITKTRRFIEQPDFDPPLAFMRGRTVKFVDLDNDGDLDLINFAFSSVNNKQGSESYLYENDGKGNLTLKATLPKTIADGQKTLITDFNNDGAVDLLIYGHGAIRGFLNKGQFSFDEQLDLFADIDTSNVTSVAEIDFDNDGDFDLFLTRGNEFVAGDTFYDSKNKILGYYSKRGPFKLDDFPSDDVVSFENMQSQWPNKEVYLGESAYEYEFPGETHSGRDFRLVNSDSLGFPDKLAKKGTYIGYIGNGKWRLAGNIWSPTTGVIHNVKSYTETGRRHGLKDLLLINNKSRFTLSSDAVFPSAVVNSTSSNILDINNDGYSDIVVVKRGDLISENRAVIYLNQHGESFSLVTNHNLMTHDLGSIGMSVASFDYNGDGALDILIGNDRGKWHLFENTSIAKANEYLLLKFDLPKSLKTSPLGALVNVSACKNMQSFRLGKTSAAYSLNGELTAYFGLGNCKETRNVIIVYSNGQVSSFKVDSQVKSKGVSKI